MKTKSALKYFGTKSRIACACGITKQAVSQWGEIVPLKQARKLREKSRYQLAMCFSDYREK